MFGLPDRMTSCRNRRKTVIIKQISFFCRNARLGVIACAVFVYGLSAASPVLGAEPVQITIDQALQLALVHNESLKAARTTILQNEAQEITANLRPNPVLSWDALYFPIYRPSKYTAD